MAQVKAEPELPSDTYQPPPMSPQVQPYYPPGQPMGQPMGPPMGQATMGQPYAQPYAQPYYPTMGYPAGGVGQGQPGLVYAQVAYPQQQVLYAQPVAVPSQVVSQPIQCVICTVQVQGAYYRCVGCRNNGKPGGYLICPTCHSRQRVREKGFFDELTHELGQFQYNYSSQRPHENWHQYEPMNTFTTVTPTLPPPSPVVVQMPPQPVVQQPQPAAAGPMALPAGQVQLMISCRGLPKSGFGMVLPDPSVAVSINGKQVAFTEQVNQTSNPSFQRMIEVPSAEAKISFTAYSNGKPIAVGSAQMSELLKSPDRTWTKLLDDPKTGYRLQTGSVEVRWVTPQAAAPVMAVLVAPPQYAQGPQYSGVPQQTGPPPAYPA